MHININGNSFALGIGLGILILVLVGAATSLPRTRCSDPIDVDASHDVYYEVGVLNSTLPVSVYYEPDTSGNPGTAGEIAMQMCMTIDNTNSCTDMEFDSNGDGTPNTHLLDGSSMAKSGVRGLGGFPYLRITETIAGSNDQYVVCRGW